MPRQRDLKTAAFAVLGSFISRNNDVHGYWGLGQLYRHALTHNCDRVEIDLLSGCILPPSPLFSSMVKQYAKLLLKRLEARRLRGSPLSKATISIRFRSHMAAPKADNWAYGGDLFECVITLMNEAGKSGVAMATGTCWAHDPDRELRSARAG